ncbi:DUF4166 domain-containing protein [Antiquaquibacter soli]|uniref:DUF4166 domain-containing protein n=1 Tax=Antiquaquibacter soli TaxID=3064523 RepID=A0ABT9BNL2_9MICO|nr:DUF4166 domain-containing protein [Protaetiibacter sp. WY-16]MDO7881977.1 DUF4166 domain-containing protein [Protaetiibacter sp. WY-16]
MRESPWVEALGSDLERLHPRLRAYFGTIPEGSIGHGRGVFDVVGTPRRWLWPLVALLSLDAVLFPVWERDVPFRVRNAPVDGRVDALRRFEFARGARTMVDSTSFEGALVDRLGRRGLISAQLVARVRDGMLVLESSRTRVLGIPVPVALSPRITLIERWDDAAERQHVSLVLDAPLIGRLYEYSGHFDYRVVAHD